jgi:DNA-binding CsgD family transcriptional regulator
MTGGVRKLTIGKAVPLLPRWGLSADADLVYRYLVSFGPQTTTAVAASLGLGLRRVRTALEQLEEPSLVQSVGEPSGSGFDATWHAIPVNKAVTTLRRRAAPRVPAAAAVASQPVADRRFAVRHLPDRAASRRRIAELVTVESVEHLSMNPEEVISSEALAVAAPMDIALLERRVRLQSLGRAPTDGDRLSRHATRLAQLGGMYREATRLPHKLMIFDRRIALVAVDPLDLDHGTWEFDDPTAVDSLVRLFLRHWMDATDPHRDGVRDIVLTPREKAVIALLAEGHTDDTAAQRLGMSRRSITYALRGLMDRIGVENRFQLGLALGAMYAATPPQNTFTEGDDR